MACWQVVRILSNKSETKNNHTEKSNQIKQGSIAGLLVFILFLNNFVDNIKGTMAKHNRECQHNLKEGK